MIDSTSLDPTALAQPADLPAVDRLLSEPAFALWVQQHGRQLITQQLRKLLQQLRAQALAGKLARSELNVAQLAARFEKQLQQYLQPQLRPMINLTGTVLHTNLGRALLPDEAVQAVLTALTTPANLEFDVRTGKRGDRDDLVEALICELTGAEAATVVNNNAAAVLLMLSTMAAGREVVVSRGELVEIGGAFRIPDIMQRAGARLVEVGTTNRTHAHDYEQAICEQTAMLMKVHCSNYAVVGFTKEVNLAELVQIGRRHGVPTTVDLGSGTLVDLSQWGLPKEPTVKETIAAGADVVTFSGDKLLGGPQAGLIVGRKDLIQAIKKNPLKRALRVGKLTLAALEPVLALYRSPEHLAQRLTTLRLLTRPAVQMQEQAKALQPLLQQALGSDYTVAAEPMLSQIGSGAMPIDVLPSYGLVVRYVGAGRAGGPIMRVEKWLRGQQRPVIGRIQHDTLFLDLRCLSAAEQAILQAQWSTALA